MYLASPVLHHFWLICGLWVGVFGGLYTWFNLTRARNSEHFSKERAARYARNYGLALLIPSLILWQLQLSLAERSTPFFTNWASPQKEAAITLLVTCWIALFTWVNFRGGAQALSDMFRAFTPKQPELFTSESAMRLISVLVLMGGFFGLWMARNAT
jgi:hypothetical protein